MDQSRRLLEVTIADRALYFFNGIFDLPADFFLTGGAKHRINRLSGWLTLQVSLQRVEQDWVVVDNGCFEVEECSVQIKHLGVGSQEARVVIVKVVADLVVH